MAPLIFLKVTPPNLLVDVKPVSDDSDGLDVEDESAPNEIPYATQKTRGQYPQLWPIDPK